MKSYKLPPFLRLVAARHTALATFIILLLSQSASAQTFGRRFMSDVRPIEVEFSIGMTYPIGSYHEGKGLLGPMGGIEVRYNFPQSGWDAGLLADVTISARDFAHLPGSAAEEWKNHKKNTTINVGFTGHYNFRQGANINPFVGGGLALSINEVPTGNHQTTSPHYTIGIIPQAGIELWGYARLTANAHISRKGFSTAGLTLGIVIGGKSRSKPDTTVEDLLDMILGQ